MTYKPHFWACRSIFSKNISIFYSKNELVQDLDNSAILKAPIVVVNWDIYNRSGIIGMNDITNFRSLISFLRKLKNEKEEIMNLEKDGDNFISYLYGIIKYAHKH